MLSELCAELRNYFVKEIHSGIFTINGSGIESLPFLSEGQYFRIVGSVFNDGVWLNTSEGMSGMRPETFSGAVWAMAVPLDVIALSEDIEAWRNKYERIGSAAMSPYMSESFGGYSYQKGSSLAGSGGNGGTSWQNTFRTKLNKWRKL